MIVIVCGPSKSGKSSLIKAAMSQGLRCTTIKGSTLLRESGREIESLTAAQALDNQPIVLAALERSDDGGQSIVFDGHLLIETVDGPQLVPDSAFKSLRLGGVVSVTADPITLSARRKNTGFTDDPAELAELMLIETTQARRLARKHGVPHFTIDNDDVAGFRTATSSCFTS